MTAPPGKNSFAKAEWLAAALVTLAIVWLHFYFRQNVGGLWRDEVNTVNLAQNPSFAALSHDSFPILMPLLVKFWLPFGKADLWLRLLGMIFGLAIPAAFWLVARAMRRPPLFSLVLFGLNPLMIRYGDSLRAYGLGAALIVLALAAMCAFLKKPNWPRAGILAFAAILSVQALYQNAILFFAICLGAFAICGRRKDFPSAAKIFCAGFLAALSLLPYYSNIIGLPQAAIELRRGFSPFITLLNFQTATGFPFEQFTAAWEILMIIVIGFAALSLARAGDKNEMEKSLPTFFAGSTLLAIVILFLGFLWFAAVPARSWYFLPPLALAAACFDFGISLPSLPRLVRVSVFGFLIGAAAISIPLAGSNLRGHFTNVDKLAARIEAQASPDDFIIVTPWFCGISFARYFHGATAWTTLPPLADHSVHRYDLTLAQMQNTNALAPVFQKISATLRAGHRVWVAGWLNLPPKNAAPPIVLPPPPLKFSGWSDTPYVSAWAAQTGFFLARHGERFEKFNTSENDAVNYQEDLRLLAVEGWRD